MSFYDNIEFKTPNKSSFSRSHSINTSMQFDKLYPTFVDEVLPGDTWHISQDFLARFAPMLTPAFGDLKMTTHFFFVPNRLISPDWKTFISSAGSSDDEIQTNKNRGACMPTIDWNKITNVANTRPCGFQAKSLSDYLGVPVFDDYKPFDAGEAPKINLLPYLAYHKVWSDFYRSEMHDDLFDYEGPLWMFNDAQSWTQFTMCFAGTSGRYDFYGMKDDSGNDINTFDDIVNGDISLYYNYNNTIANHNNFDSASWQQFVYALTELRNRCWRRDYFTTSLPSLTNGDIPIIPVGFQNFSTSSSATYNADIEPGGLYVDSNQNVRTSRHSVDWTQSSILADKLGFTISQLRLANALQTFKEKTIRAGKRYVENLASHFGVIASDATLQRSQYIGGMCNDVYVNEITQTSSSTEASPQGQYSGQALCGGRCDDIYFDAYEHGIIIGITSVTTKPTYQNGIDKMFSRKDPLDFYFPEFATLSEEPVLEKQLYAISPSIASNTTLNPNTITNDSTFGYQGRYDEYRVKNSFVTGEMRDTLSSWCFTRKFNTFSDAFNITEIPASSALQTSILAGCTFVVVDQQTFDSLRDISDANGVVHVYYPVTSSSFNDISFQTYEGYTAEDYANLIYSYSTSRIVIPMDIFNKLCYTQYTPVELRSIADTNKLFLAAAMAYNWGSPSSALAEDGQYSSSCIYMNANPLTRSIVPTLTSDFLESSVSTAPFAIQEYNTADDYVYCNFRNSVQVVRPMPEHNMPAL